MNRRTLLLGALASFGLAACRQVALQSPSEGADPGSLQDSAAASSCAITRPVDTEEGWARHMDEGTYRCAVCGQALFTSDAKFDAGSPWPSFWAPIEGAVVLVSDRQEGRLSDNAIRCSNCDAHLGDVFRDGPEPTGLRYCVLSSALVFEPAPPMS